MDRVQLCVPRVWPRIVGAFVLLAVLSGAAVAQVEILALDADRGAWDTVVTQAKGAGLSASVKGYNETALQNQLFQAGVGLARFDVAQALTAWAGNIGTRFLDLSPYISQLQGAGLEIYSYGGRPIGVVLPWRKDAFAGVSARSTRVKEAVQLLTYLRAGASAAAAGKGKAVPLTIGTITVTKTAKKNPSVDGSLEAFVAAARQAVPTGVLTALAQVPAPARDALTKVAEMLGIPLSPTGEVTLVVESKGGGAVPLGIAVEATTSPLGLSKVTIPLDQLEGFLAQVGAGVYVRLPYVPHEMAVTSQGAALVGTAAFHAAGNRGSGVKIAVIDLGFAGLSTAQAQGDLLYSVITRDFTGTGIATGISHGTAVAQIVYDVAPDAQLYLVKIANEVDLDNAVTYCISEGVHVINHSLGWFNTNFYDGTGTVADIARRATSAGILWIQAAGNSGLKHYGATFTDGNSDAWHDTDVTFTATAGQQVVLYLTWDSWPATADDYDLYLYGPTGTLVASSTATQGGTEQPTERFSTTAGTAGTYRVRIQKADGAARRLSLFSIIQELTPTVSAMSIPAPGNASEVLTVGAINWSTYTTGPIAPYSSRGPTGDGRSKPDLAAPDNVTTGVGFYNPFPGTSAAAPHVAGVAALLKAEAPALTRATLTSRILSFCVAMGDPYAFGAGRLEARPQPPARADLVVDAITWSPTNPVLGATVTFTVTVRNQGTASAGSFVLRLQGSGPLQDATISSLAAGASTTRTFTLPLTTSPETFTATADAQNQVTESDETNNTRQVTVTAAAQADLVVDAITFTPTNPVLGQTVTFTVTVRNQGTASAGAFVLRLQGSGPLQDTTISSLAAGASTARTFTLPLTTSPETFTATADAQNQVTESDETNNTRQVTVTAAAQADLVVDAITWTPTNPVLGQTVTFTVTVRNQGTASAGAFVLRLQGSGPLQDTTISSLAAGASTARTFTLPLTTSPETFTATADANNQITESDETNNTRQVTVTAAAQADLVVDAITWTPTNPTLGGTITFTVTVRNQGAASAGAFVLRLQGSGPLQDTTIASLGVGSSTVRTFTLPLTTSPETFTATADAQNQVTESDETNNTRQVTVTAAAQADLVVDAITWTPTNPTLGGTITFTVTVRNQGAASAGSFVLRLQGSGPLQDTTIASLGVGSSTTRTFTLPLTTSPETFTATADAQNQVTESDETNNTRQVTVTAAAQADLVVDAITWTPTNPTLGGTITFTVTVRNQGAASAGAFVLRLQGSGPLQDTTIASLGVGASTARTFTLPLATSPETFTATADVNNQVTESDETNNTRQVVVTALARADLVVDAITWTPTNPTLGGTITFTVTVRNQGAASAGSFVVRLQGTGPSQDRTVSSLGTGASTSLTFTLPLSTTPETFTATADVFNQVAESDEANNTRQVQVIGAAPPLAFTVATDKSVYTVGEAVRITVTLSRASYVYLVELDAAGRAILIFPNWRDANNLVPAGMTQFPRSTTYAFIASEPVGSEQIVGFAADRQVPFFPTTYPSGYPILSTNGPLFLSQVRSWLGGNVASGSWAEASAPFTIQAAPNLPPTASFTFSPTSPLVNQWITFDGRGSSDPDGTITSWAWSFGDGATGTGSQIQKRYSAPGTYTVTLTVTDNRGATGSTSRTVVVTAPNQPPTASFTFSPTNPNPGQNVTFDASASSDPDGMITAYAWSFGDGTTGTGVNVTKSYAAAGTYTVTLTVTDNGGATGTTARTIQVGPPPPTLPGMPAIDRPGIYVWGDAGNKWHVTVAGDPSWTGPRPFEITLETQGTFSNRVFTPAGPTPTVTISGGITKLVWTGTIASGWADLAFDLAGATVMSLTLYLDTDGNGVAKPASGANLIVFLRACRVNPPGGGNPFVLSARPGSTALLPSMNFRVGVCAGGTWPTCTVITWDIEYLEAEVGCR